MYHRTLKTIPGRLVFEEKHLANWRLIRQRKQAQIDKYVIREILQESITTIKLETG